MTGDVAPPEFFPFLQICIDSAFILPQYLVLWKLLVLQVERLLQIRSRSCKVLQGKIVHGGFFKMATKKKAKKKKH